MTAGRRLRALALAAMVLGLGAAGPAQAADEIAIDHVESDRGDVSLLLSTDGLPPGTPIEDMGVDVELNGSRVEATTKLIDAGDLDRSTVLVLDDLHWADPTTVRLVDGALRSLHKRPLLVLALARPALRAA